MAPVQQYKMANYDGNERFVTGSIEYSIESINALNVPYDGNDYVFTSVVTTISGSAPEAVPLYRSVVAGEYVATEGSPAVGYTTTTIIGYN